MGDVVDLLLYSTPGDGPISKPHFASIRALSSSQSWSFVQRTGESSFSLLILFALSSPIQSSSSLTVKSTQYQTSPQQPDAPPLKAHHT